MDQYNQEVNGSVSLCRDGSLHITAEADKERYHFHVLTTQDNYTVYLCECLVDNLCVPDEPQHATSGVRVNDLVSARVEIPMLLDEYYGPDRYRTDLFRRLIQEAWKKPSEVKSSIDSLLTEAICNEEL